MTSTVRADSQYAPNGHPLDFLGGGGEMGARMRLFDWSRTPLGAPESWPQSLKTAVRIMLTSRQPFWLGWGPELTYLYNDPYKTIIGGKHPDALGQPFRQVWREIWDVVGPMADHVITHNEGTYVEAQLLIMERHGYQEETYYTFSYSPVPDDKGGPGGLICANTDDTLRVLGERQLATLRELATRTATARDRHQACTASIEALSTNSRDLPFALIFLTAEQGGSASLCACSPGAESLADRALWPDEPPVETDYKIVDMARVTVPTRYGIWPKPPSSAIILPISGATRTSSAGVLVVGLNPFRKLDKTYKDFLFLVAGQIAAAIGAADSYQSERRRAEALAELDRAKTTFFSNVSHEFRTPLTLMIGPVEEALGNPDIPDSVRRQLELARSNSLRLLKLVNSLLDFARIEAGRVRAAFQPLDLAALTRNVASTFRSAIERAGLELRVSCDPLTQPAYVDPEMWEKIVLNLLSNAFKYTLKGTIEVRLHAQDASAILQVSDTGVGIPQGELPRLFERFHRVEGTRGRTHEGSGIGLALVQELVKLHGGTIDVASEVERGSSFRVCIPLGAAHNPPQRVAPLKEGAFASVYAQPYVQEALRWIPEFSSAPAPPAALQVSSSSTHASFALTAGSRVLLADDNADMCAYVRELLSPIYSVEAVSDGDAALEAVRRNPPDLVLSDVMMPNVSGFELIKGLRAEPALKDIPIILLSARAGEESRVEGLQAGADDYLVKPFSARELIARVGAHLALRRARQEAMVALKESESLLMRRTQQYETLLNDAPLGVYLVDADLKIRDVNPRARSVFGNIPDLIGRDFAEVVHILWSARYAEELVVRFRHTLDTGTPYATPERIEERLDRGVIEYYEWEIHRIPLPDGRFGVVCYFRDISAHVHARTRLEAADRQKNEFLAMLAHELRNPLAPIRNAGEVISRLLPSEGAAREVTNILQRQVAQLSRLVDDLLDVSRITQGRIDLKRRSVQLAEVVAQAVETVGPLLREKNHDISVLSGHPLTVDGDPARLVQTFSNILTNAAKYTDSGGIIRVELHREGEQAVVSITDNGVGIPLELQPHVFDLFTQSDRTLDRSLGGLGIGLSVVRRLVEMHGGSVAVQSAGPGLGSTFTIRLPLAEKDSMDGAESEVTEVAAMRILVVDDNVDAAQSLAMLLELEGHDVHLASSGLEALERVKDIQPRAVLLDIGLPRMDGYEVARRMRLSSPGQSVWLIALTGYGQAEDKAKAVAAGFDDHLTKPVDMSVLSRALQKAQ